MVFTGCLYSGFGSFPPILPATGSSVTLSLLILTCSLFRSPPWPSLVGGLIVTLSLSALCLCGSATTQKSPPSKKGRLDGLNGCLSAGCGGGFNFPPGLNRRKVLSMQSVGTAKFLGHLGELRAHLQPQRMRFRWTSMFPLPLTPRAAIRALPCPPDPWQ